MTNPLDAKQLVTFEELLMSEVVSQDVLKEEFLEMVKPLDRKMGWEKNL